jgi:hypothetical protein
MNPFEKSHPPGKVVSLTIVGNLVETCPQMSQKGQKGSLLPRFHEKNIRKHLGDRDRERTDMTVLKTIARENADNEIISSGRDIWENAWSFSRAIIFPKGLSQIII